MEAIRNCFPLHSSNLWQHAAFYLNHKMGKSERRPASQGSDSCCTWTMTQSDHHHRHFDALRPFHYSWTTPRDSEHHISQHCRSASASSPWRFCSFCPVASRCFVFRQLRAWACWADTAPLGSMCPALNPGVCGCSLFLRVKWLDSESLPTD